MKQRETQREKVLRVLKEANGKPVPGYVVAQVGGLQFQTRVWELRHQEGYKIRCDLKHVDGVVHSEYTLLLPKGQQQLFSPGEPTEMKREENPYPF